MAKFMGMLTIMPRYLRKTAQGLTWKKATGACAFALAALLLLELLTVPGCSRPSKAPPYMIRVRDRKITVDEFKLAVAAAADEAVAGEVSLDPEALNQLRVQVLKQLTEELIIMERGEDLGLSLSEAELETAITRIKSDYPDNTFDETLLENAIAFDVWKKKLAVRLLIEKIVADELVDQVQLSSEDIAGYYKSLPQSKQQQEGTNDEQNKKIVIQLRRLKAEEDYQQWINRLREQYPVEINRQEWENLVRVEES